MLHGKSKVARRIEFHYGPEPPKASGAAVPVWIRDGWSDSLKSVEDDARQAGPGSPTVFVFIERRAAEELKHALAECKAAEDTLEIRGEPTTSEGKDARRAMTTRREMARQKVDLALTQIFAEAKVLQGGGNDVEGASLTDKVETAATFALARLFPQFSDADDPRWSQVLTKARQGDGNALEAVDYQGEVAKHPVCSAILMHVGSGKKGKEIRSTFAADPCGWPQDAVDAALVVLALTEHLQAQQNEKPILAKQLDQSKIGSATFRVESRPLTAAEKIKLRTIFQKAGVACKPNEEALAAGEFLRELETRAHQAGGDAPLPARPDTRHLDDLAGQAGNEQLASLLTVGDQLVKEAQAWDDAASLAAARLPRWQDLQKLLGHAASLPVTSEVRPQVEAIVEQRCLLAEPDPVPPRLRTAHPGTSRSPGGSPRGVPADARTGDAASGRVRALDETARGPAAAHPSPTRRRHRARHQGRHRIRGVGHAGQNAAGHLA